MAQLLNSVLRMILPARTYERLIKSQSKRRGEKYYETLAVEDWQDVLDHPALDPVLKEMMLAYEQSQPEAMASKYWIALNRKNVGQLLDQGFDHFKQTVALNYSIWLINAEHPHVQFLKTHLPDDTVRWAERQAKLAPQHALLSRKESRFYNLLTLLLWKYAEQEVGVERLATLEEPLLGHPPAIQVDGRWISQDLGNAALECQSIAQGLGADQSMSTVLELGAGYGRTASVLLRWQPNLRYVIVDVPPALYIAQRYLTSVFPERRAFTFRSFEHFADVEEEFNASQLAFLLPNQLEMLPDLCVDVFVAIDCLHEMRPEQIEYYFAAVDRLARQLYFSCSKKTSLPYEDMIIAEQDYPVRRHWQEVFRRTRRVQVSYFESFYQLRKAQPATLGADR